MVFSVCQFDKIKDLSKQGLHLQFVQIHTCVTIILVTQLF